MTVALVLTRFPAPGTMSDDAPTPVGPSAAGRPFSHEPVMAAEITELLAPVPPGVVVDATVGGGGHARRLLRAHPHLRVVGFDRDETAIVAAAANLAEFGPRVELCHHSFDHLRDSLSARGHTEISGFVFDLGVSSPQLDRADRGFSYRDSGPLDMRMDPRQPTTAADIVNGYDEAELVDVLRHYGDERHARRVARAVVAARPVTTTGQLAEIVRSAIPAPARRQGGHPAKRTFQALRIEVNRELDLLPGALDAAIDLLVPTGRGAVLSYHSGEDRIVKERFRRAAGDLPRPRPDLPAPDAVAFVRVLVRGDGPGAAEVEANPRSASARLRAVEKVEVA